MEKQKVRKKITGMTDGRFGRFDFTITDFPVQMLRVDGSFHSNQISELLKICKHLNLSCFDPQTGNRVYLQGREACT